MDTTDGNFTYSSDIGSFSGLTKLGSGMLTLTGNASYAGATSVAAGTLAVNGSLYSSGQVNVAGMLTGGGSVGNVALYGGGGLAPGNLSGAGTLTATTLTLNAGSILDYTLGAAAGGNGFVSVGQNLQLAGVGINLAVSSAGLLSPGSYLLMSYGSLNNNAGGYPASSAFSLTNSAAYVPSGDTVSVVSSGNNTLDLVISAGAPSVVAGVWQVGSGSWSTAGNWVGNQTPGGHSGDTAVFGTVATSGGTVTLDSNQSVASLGFSNSGGASFTISASNGAALTLANTNGTATISNSGGSHTIAAPIVLAANVSSLDVSASTGSALTIAGSLSETVADTTLSVSGGGALILSGTSKYSGGTTVNAATLAVSSSSTCPRAA